MEHVHDVQTDLDLLSLARWHLGRAGVHHVDPASKVSLIQCMCVRMSEKLYAIYIVNTVPPAVQAGGHGFDPWRLPRVLFFFPFQLAY